MMKLSLFSSLSILFLFTQSSSFAATNYELCNWLGSYYVTYDQCVESLKPDPTSRAADYHGLAVISVNLTITNATSVRSKFDDIAKKNEDPVTKGLLDRCSNLYSSNITSLRSAVNCAASKNYSGAADATFKFSSMPGDCDEEFRAKKGVASPLMRENLDLMNLALVAHAINDFLSKY